MRQTSLIFISFAACFFCGAAFAQLPFLQQSETLIVEEDTGEPVFLKGTNLGNWFVMEGFMTVDKPDSFKTQSDIKRMFRDQGATEQAVNDFFAQWRHHFIRKADIDYIASKGMNCIRVPLHYELFIPPAIRSLREEVIYASDQDRDTKYANYKAALGGWANDPNFTPDRSLLGFYYIDNLINWCEDNDMYIILDMHAVPGTQGEKEPIADRLHEDLPAFDLYQDSRNEDALAAIWKSISHFYKNETAIAMYDLINEPNELSDAGYVDNLRGIYKRLINSIRDNGDDHLILIQGDGFGNDYNGLLPTPHFDGLRENLVYNIHRYRSGNYQLPADTYSTDGSENHLAYLGDAIAFRDKYQAPVFCGETGLNDNYDWAADNIEALNEVGIGWTIWTYKRYRDGMDGKGPRCMAKTPGRWLSDGPAYFSEYIQNIKFENIVENPNQEFWDGINTPVNRIPRGLIVTLQGFNSKFVSGENGSASTPMSCDRDVPQAWEKFRVEYVSGNQVRLRALSNHEFDDGGYVSSENGHKGMRADREEALAWETFTWEGIAPNQALLKGSNGKYVSVVAGDSLMCNANQPGNPETFIWQISTHAGSPLHQARRRYQIKQHERPGISVSPNPAQNAINIRLANVSESEHWTLEVATIDGKIVRRQRFESAQEITFSSRGWGEGVYIVTVITGDKRYSEKALVKE